MNAMPRRPASRLEQLLRSRQFVITAEIAPPVSCDAEDLLRKARPLRGLADAVNVTDGASARANLSAPIAAALLVREGIEPVLQLTCRDRNRIALQADLMGAAACGVHNLLCLTGDDPKAGDQPETKAVFDIDSTTLTATARRSARQGRVAVRTQGRRRRAFLPRRRRRADRPAAGLAARQARRQDRGRRRIRADPVLHGCRDRAPLCRPPRPARGARATLFLLVGIAPLRSAKSARWMQKHLYGTIIPEAYRRTAGTAPPIPAAEGQRICRRADRGTGGHPGRRRRAHHGAGQRGRGARRHREGAQAAAGSAESRVDRVRPPSTSDGKRSKDAPRVHLPCNTQHVLAKRWIAGGKSGNDGRGSSAEEGSETRLLFRRVVVIALFARQDLLGDEAGVLPDRAPRSWRRCRDCP